MSNVVQAHRAAGQFFEAAGVQSFRLEQGDGDAVVLMHGVPASCFLYRKVVAALAARGLRGVAFDLPGLGLADRPEDFDYSWTGLGAFATAAVQELGLERFHLVVHDIGGPVGFEVAAALPDRIASLTVLNTLIAVDSFTKPWPMRPFEIPGVNRVWLTSMKVRALFRALMYIEGVKDRTKVSPAELNAYVDLLFGDDNGRAFLRIMRSFETTADKAALYRGVAGSDRYPTQIVWSEHDPALKYRHYGRLAEEICGAEATLVPGRHFFQEEQPDAIADAIAALARRAPADR